MCCEFNFAGSTTLNMPISLTPTLSPGEREFSLVSRPISGAVGDGDGDGCGQLHHGVAVRLG